MLGRSRWGSGQVDLTMVRRVSRNALYRVGDREVGVMLPAPPWIITLGLTIGARGGDLYSMLIRFGVWVEDDAKDRMLSVYLIEAKRLAHFYFDALLCSLTHSITVGSPVTHHLVGKWSSHAPTKAWHPDDVLAFVSCRHGDIAFPFPDARKYVEALPTP